MKPQRTITYGIPYSFCPNHTSIVEALAHAAFSAREFRIVVLVMRQTDGYLRAEDQMAPAFISARTGITKSNVSHALTRLKAWGVLRMSQGNPPFYSVTSPASWAPAAFVENDEQGKKSRLVENDEKPRPNRRIGLVENDESQIAPFYIDKHPIDKPKEEQYSIPENAWAETLQHLQRQVTPSVFLTYFQGTTARLARNGELRITAPLSAIDALSNRFTSLLARSWETVTGNPAKTIVIIAAKEAALEGT